MLSNEFFKNYKIFDEKFENQDYTLIAIIWQDIPFIEKIYNVIDDILKREKLTLAWRYVIIGDFLFSMTSFNLKEPETLIFQLNRNTYFHKIRLRADMNEILGFKWETYIRIHKTLLIGLKKEKILEKLVINSKKSKEWNTTVIIRLKTNVDSTKVERNLGRSKTPFFLININDVKFNISTFRNIWKAKRRKREMEDNKISYESIEKANAVGYILDINIYNISIDIINEERNKILTKVRCSSIEEYLIRFSKRENNDVLFKMKQKEEFMKYFQKIISFKILSWNIFGEKFYLPAFSDNRERQYLGGLISPTFYKLFRYLYKIDGKASFKNLEKSMFYQHIMKHRNLVKGNLKDENTYVNIVLYIEVGKFFIKNLGKEFMSTAEIINTGIIKYSEKNLSVDFEDKIYLNKIFNLIEKLEKGEEIDTSSLIFKDATASGLQNYGVILGYKENMLKYLNLEGEEWCDTYMYVINKFLPPIPEKFKKRKYWKSTIMTIPYNATWYGCYTVFKEKIEKDNLIFDEQLLKPIHQEFYKKVKNDIKGEFYNNLTGDLKLFKYNEWRVVSIHEYKINYKKYRDKYRDIWYVLIEDTNATERGLEANNMHFLDAQVAKMLINKFDLITIHDCFGMRICELHNVIDELNLYYNKYTNKKTYSPHIIL